MTATEIQRTSRRRRTARRRPRRRNCSTNAIRRPRLDHVPRRPVRQGSGVGALPGRARRPRPEPEAAEDRQRAALCRRRTEPVLPQPDRSRHVRPDRRRVGQRGAEAALPPPAVHRRGDLVPAVQRAGRRLRLRRAGVEGRSRRRRVDRQRPEGVDDAGPPLALRAAGGAHRPRGREARRPHGLRRRHAGTRCRGAAAAPDDRRGRVQRGVLHRRPHPRLRDARRAGRRLARVADDADERAGVDRRHDAGKGIRARSRH